MISKDINLKIKENKVKGNNLSAPRFTITYEIPKNHNKDSSQISYKIISLLNKNQEIFIEVNSSLLSVLTSEREKETMDFIQSVKSMNLEYRYKQLPGRSSGSIFGSLFKKGLSVDHEIITFIPKEIWLQDSFKTILPKFGIRYYICKEEIDASKILDDMNKGFLLDEEKLNLFQYIIFDCNYLSQMGIVSANTTLDELQKILI